jgi:hypothetical protein
MKKILGLSLVFACLSGGSGRTEQAPQVWTGRLSDSICGASHQAKAGAMNERECIFECMKSLAKYVLVDLDNKIVPIANQDLAGFPLYAGRMVRITGELKGGALVAAKVEAIPPHLHIGHVMTNWRETPGNVGFLIAATSDAKVAVIHAKLAATTPDNLDQMKLHAGHVLNALDPSIEPRGPGSGYGVKKAAAGALQHLDFAAKAEGASANVKSHAVQVSASLTDAIQWMDQAIATAQKIRAAGSAAEAAPLTKELVALTTQIVEGEGGLTEAQTQMRLMMKGEGLLENMPR